MAITEHDIVQTMRHNPDKGLSMLMAQYGEPLYWHIRRLVVDHADAQDAAQETFIRIFNHFGSYREGTSLKAWVYKIATNEALRLIGRRKEPLVSLDDNSASLAQASEWIDYSDLEAVKLQKAIQSLPAKQQVTFSLRYYDEMDYEQIAEITASTPKAAKANYHVAKGKVIEYMKLHD